MRKVIITKQGDVIPRQILRYSNSRESIYDFLIFQGEHMWMTRRATRKGMPLTRLEFCPLALQWRIKPAVFGKTMEK